jgi:hypothetical protein
VCVCVCTVASTKTAIVAKLFFVDVLPKPFADEWGKKLVVVNFPYLLLRAAKNVNKRCAIARTAEIGAPNKLGQCELV